MSDDYKAAQAKLMLEQASDVDVIITTALIPGRKAPVLVNQEMLNVMKPGSVLVDLAAANGGNVAQTEANKVCRKFDTWALLRFLESVIWIRFYETCKWHWIYLLTYFSHLQLIGITS